MSDEKIVTLVARHVSDIPFLMEQMAQRIREGDEGSVIAAAAVFLTDDHELRVCGWGQDADAVRSIGLLHMGAAWLSANKVAR